MSIANVRPQTVKPLQSRTVDLIH